MISLSQRVANTIAQPFGQSGLSQFLATSTNVVQDIAGTNESADQCLSAASGALRDVLDLEKLFGVRQELHLGRVRRQTVKHVVIGGHLVKGQVARSSNLQRGINV